MNSETQHRRHGWTTSLGLLAQMRATNTGPAWERFTTLYTRLLDYWFERARVPPADWADLRQEVFFAVARKLNDFAYTPGQGGFRGWLRVIASRKIADIRRKPIPLAASDWLDSCPQMPPDEAAAEQRIFYKQALDLVCMDFEPTTWQAFWLVEIEDHPPATVAEVLGIKLEAVYVKKSRVMQRLRTEFGRLLDDEPPNVPPHDGTETCDVAS